MHVMMSSNCIKYYSLISVKQCFPGGSDYKESACVARDLGLLLELGRSPGEGNGYPVLLPGEFHGQVSLADYSPWSRKELDMTEQLSIHTHIVK